MAGHGTARRLVGAWHTVGVALCAIGVLALFAVVASEARELTLTYGSFVGWLGPLLLFGAVCGGIIALLAYVGVRLAAVTRHRKLIVASVVVATIVISLAGGLVGALQY